MAKYNADAKRIDKYIEARYPGYQKGIWGSQ